MKQKAKKQNISKETKKQRNKETKKQRNKETKKQIIYMTEISYFFVRNKTSLKKGIETKSGRKTLELSILFFKH